VNRRILHDSKQSLVSYEQAGVHNLQMKGFGVAHRHLIDGLRNTLLRNTTFFGSDNAGRQPL
jgi:hypothetical protein